MARLTKKQERERAEKLERWEAEQRELERTLRMCREVTRDSLIQDGEAEDVIAVALEGVVCAGEGYVGAFAERDRARDRIELCRIRALELRLSARSVTPGKPVGFDRIRAVEAAAPAEERDAAKLARVSRWFDRFARQDLDKRETVAAVLRGEPSDPFLAP